tara:strand:+ start:369 stop:764 length:396 start_codon:yes stop_codon:yes gene_type:complete
MTDKDAAQDFFNSLGIKKALIVKSFDGEAIDQDVNIDILAKWQDGTFTYHRNVFNSTYSLFWHLDEIGDPSGTEFMEAYPVTDDFMDEYVEIDPKNSNLDRNFTWSELMNSGPIEISIGWEEIADNGDQGE